MEEAGSAKRQIAKKASIIEILEGEYIKKEGWEPNHVLTKYGEELSRVNLIATVVNVGEEQAVVDDGTGTIILQGIEGLQLGDTINIIGRPRVYDQDRFVHAEIARKIEDKTWVQIRKKEIELAKKDMKVVEKVEEEIIEKVEDGTKISDKTFNYIRELDQGQGADYQEVLQKAGEGAESVIANLLMEGEIFEVSPGRLKVLE